MRFGKASGLKTASKQAESQKVGLTACIGHLSGPGLHNWLHIYRPQRGAAATRIADAAARICASSEFHHLARLSDARSTTRGEPDARNSKIWRRSKTLYVLTEN